MMLPATTTRTRSATSTCTASRVEAVLDLFLGDLVGFIARGLMTRDRALDWLRDLNDVLVLEALERFQVKIVLPGGRTVALDYEVSDDGSIQAGAGCGGFAAYWIPPTATVRLVIRWRRSAPKFQEAYRLLRARGWIGGTMMDASGAPERAFVKDGYGLNRRVVGVWQE